jgi:hypothetical protein
LLGKWLLTVCAKSCLLIETPKDKPHRLARKKASKSLAMALQKAGKDMTAINPLLLLKLAQIRLGSTFRNLHHTNMVTPVNPQLYENTHQAF